jgi:hypothetical protein
MRLAVVSDNQGTIRALAVCQVTFDGDRSTTHEIKITGKPISAAVGFKAETFRSSIVEAPSSLDDQVHHELCDSLAAVQKSMYVCFDGAEPYLRACSDRHRRTDCEPNEKSR